MRAHTYLLERPVYVGMMVTPNPILRLLSYNSTLEPITITQNPPLILCMAYLAVRESSLMFPPSESLLHIGEAEEFVVKEFNTCTSWA